MIARLVVVLAAVAASVAALGGAPSVSYTQSDLDALMKDVVARRDENWKKLQQYILDERDEIQVRGGSAVPVWGEVREYSWFIQEGYFVKSPVKVNGVEIGEDERRRSEARFLRRAKARDKKEKPEETAAEPERQVGDESPMAMGSLIAQARQPEFVDSAYFLKFKFEQGKYAFVGRETFEGRDVLRVEYYPEKLFSHEQEREEKRKQEGTKDREEDLEAALEKMMNKVSLVTIWIEPASKQIVKYTFDNVNFDFLPAAWLVRIGDIKAQMTMSQPFKDQKDLWLPRDVAFYFSAMLAIGPFDVSYKIGYHDYREAKMAGRIK